MTHGRYQVVFLHSKWGIRDNLYWRFLGFDLSTEELNLEKKPNSTTAVYETLEDAQSALKRALSLKP